MSSISVMLSFATLAYLVALGVAVGAASLASWALREVYTEQRIRVQFIRGGSERNIAERVKRCLRGGLRRGLVDGMVAFILLPAILAILLFFYVASAFYLAAQGNISFGAMNFVIAIISVVGAFAAVKYVGSGARLGNDYFPPVDVGPWIVSQEIKVTRAAQILRFTLIDLAITLHSFAAMVGASQRVQTVSGGEVRDPIQFLYIAGWVPMFLVAWALGRILPRAFPHTAALKLLLNMLRTGSLNNARSTLRASLRVLCRLADHCAASASHRESAAGVQNPQAVLYRSLAGNLRNYLSNRTSIGIDLEDIRDDIRLSATFVCNPHSTSAFNRLADRLKAFNDDGSPREIYQEPHRSRVATRLNGFLVGLERTHQGFTRTIAIIAIIAGLILFATGAVKIAEIIKVVKV